MNTKKIENISNYLAGKWWFYLLILILFFLPSYSQQPLESAQESSNLIVEVLKNPLILSYDFIASASKILFLISLILLPMFPKKLSYYFSALTTILLLAIAVFQNMGRTDTYGLAVIIGNLVIQMIVVIFWLFELFIRKNKFIRKIKPSLRWWIIPLAVFAFWMPVSSEIKPDFNLLYFLNNESILTYCMITPVIITILIIFFPNINISVLRITSFVGILFGIVNMLTWFVLNPSFWWMGVLHIPLMAISTYGFLLSIIKIRDIENKLKKQGV